jgi:hypothetical protein
VSQSDLLLARRAVMKSRINKAIIDISGNFGYDGGIVGAGAEIARFALWRSSAIVGIGNRWGLGLLLDLGFLGPEHRLAKAAKRKGS